MMNTLKENELNAIAHLIEEGFTSGILDDLKWEVSFEKHDWDEEEDNYKHIANLIKKGYTSGYYPSWQLEAENI